MWFVLDNALVLPEYLVEFEYSTNAKGALDSMSDAVNEECNSMFEAINSVQKVLDNSYIRHAAALRNQNEVVHIHLTSSDLDRSDMGCLKKTLANFMNHCHIPELINNAN
mmetsp:Transcript_13692/g.9850  ORF Transcript_13692/g.9850 Transcript_13692/m.9850 type:complete len:110 (+) Transcript_13692:895-1224(+)